MIRVEDQLEQALYKNKLLEENLIEILKEKDMMRDEIELLRNKLFLYE